MLVINQPKGKLMHCEEDVVLSNAHIKKKDPKGCLASFIVILILIIKLASNCSFSVFGVAKQRCQIWKLLFCCCCFYHSQVCSSTRSHAFSLRLVYDVRVG